MVSNQKLFSVGDFDFRFQHLLVLGILICSISISMFIRSGPLAYETELFEYDPFFNYRATEYLVSNGFQNYLEWYDDKSWHPFGRDISETSQVVLHITAASLYQLFNFGMSLHTFTVYFPLFVGGMTSIVIFGFVRVLGGTSAGLIASLMFSVSVPILVRGFAGWFKSEPLGIFFGILGLYLFVSGIKSNKGKISFLKLIGAALFVSLAISAWGGSIFFIIVILAFYFVIPFLKSDGKFLFWAIPAFSISTILFLLMFERTSNFLISYIGLAIIIPTIFVIVSEIIKKFSSESKKIRNCLIFLVSIIASSIGIFSAGYIGLPTFRYLNAINPLLFSTDPLTDSVQEHGVTSLNVSFFFFSIFIIFALIGIWYIFSKKSTSIQIDMKAFSLIVSIFAIYLSSAFTRLELFAAIGLLILGGIGVSLFFKEIYKVKNSLIKYVFSISILCLFLIPLVLPVDDGWTSYGDYSPTILSGGTGDKTLVSYDWIESMKWLKGNTPENSVVAAWWDYGYWITTLSDRTTLVDNATLNDWQIKKVAYSLLSSPDTAWKILHSDIETNVSSSYNSQFLTIFDTETPLPPNCVTVTAKEYNLTGKPVNFCDQPLNGMDADYVLVYVTVEKIAAPGTDISLYQMLAGGDESKKNWFARISNQNVADFVQPDGQTPTHHLLNNTALGQMIPFEIVAYFDLQTSMIYDFYDDRFIPIYQKKIKLNDSENDPFYLVYASPGYYSDIPGQKNIILIYKINPYYQP